MGKTKGYLTGGSVKVFKIKEDNGLALIPAYKRKGKIIRGHIRGNPGWEDSTQETRFHKMPFEAREFTRQYIKMSRNELIRARKTKRAATLTTRKLKNRRPNPANRPSSSIRFKRRNMQ